jgi:hypothetical protein
MMTDFIAKVSEGNTYVDFYDPYDDDDLPLATWKGENNTVDIIKFLSNLGFDIVVA